MVARGDCCRRHCQIALKLKKPQGTTTYCYSAAEVQAIVELLSPSSGTGMDGQRRDRVGVHGPPDQRTRRVALVRHRPGTLDAASERTRPDSRGDVAGKKSRTTKSHHDRSLPIHDEFKNVLKRLTRASDGRVFHGPKGGRLKPDTVRNIFKREVLPKLADRFPADDKWTGHLEGPPSQLPPFLLLHVGGQQRSGATPHVVFGAS